MDKSRVWLKAEQEEEASLVKTLMTKVPAKDLEELGYSLRARIDKLKVGVGRRWTLVLKRESRNVLKLRQGDLVQIFDWTKALAAQFYCGVNRQGTGVISKVNSEKVSVILDKESENFADDQGVKSLVVSDSPATYLRYVKVLDQLQKLGPENALVKALFPENVQKYQAGE